MILSRNRGASQLMPLPPPAVEPPPEPEPEPPVEPPPELEPPWLQQP